MTADPLAFFTIDHGTASTAAALIAPAGGRFRLIAAGAQPAGLPLDALLAPLAASAAETEPDLLPGAGEWLSWARLEVVTRRPPGALLAATDARRLSDLQTAVEGAGWRIVGRLSPEETDALEATELCLSASADLVVVGAPERLDAGGRRTLADLCALVAAALDRREGPAVLLLGSAADEVRHFAPSRVLLGPPAPGGPQAGPSDLRDLLRALSERLGRPESGAAGGREVAASGPLHLADAMGDVAAAADSWTVQARPPDGHAAFRTAILSLAALLERRVEGVEVGASAGQRVLAGPDGPIGELLLAEAALVPESGHAEDRAVDGILRWSTARGDAALLRDRVRNLGLWPWREAAGDGAELRLAAARAALERLDARWRLPAGQDGLAPSYAADLLVVSGGAFAVAPPPAVALAAVDTLRRAGGLTMAYDHARVLAPLGAIPSEDDRRRLLTDLMDDVLVPLGSAVLVAGLRPGRRSGTLRIGSEGAVSEVPVMPGGIQMVDLPPGLTATAELDLREGAWLGVRARRLSLELSGGLGGLLVDTRGIPLRLPDRAERRRELLEAWQRPLWLADTP